MAKVGADFVWRMADVLDCYALPGQANEPLVCVDERPCQLLADPAPRCLPRQDSPPAMISNMNDMACAICS